MSRSTIITNIRAGKYPSSSGPAGRDRLVATIADLMRPSTSTTVPPEWSSEEVAALQAVADTLSAIRDATDVACITGPARSDRARNIMGDPIPQRDRSLFRHGTSSRIQGVR